MELQWKILETTIKNRMSILNMAALSFSCPFTPVSVFKQKRLVFPCNNICQSTNTSSRPKDVVKVAFLVGEPSLGGDVGQGDDASSLQLPLSDSGYITSRT